ncbi:uncharacterized protein F4812DRAFT_430495 [Daldinia caldariorum]|uniref:uncharacterized protein n=1 Tax=Daldinia caldariorum TaxID=326644 RepID=UPI002008C9FF|nr:uncharacterized protein F4812DRAFT_430495 [Daldinia caldariorum]KAI1467684.1 hypothetical protein F4812DRAFT_430495 [Daldinia caldariorum]
MAENEPTKKYRGNCHCTTYVFEVELPENIKTGLQANCSYSYKKGGIYLSPNDSDDIEFVKGDPATLSNYTFGGVKYQFCPTCSVLLFRIDTKIYVNIRVLQQIKIWDIDTKPLDEEATPPPWTPPEFTGPEPPAEIEGARIYTGSCHCGAVTLAVKSKPIDGTYDGLVIECDCSICTRNAYCWIYPSKAQVCIVATTSEGTGMGYYSFGGGVWRKSFCRTCGVSLHNRIEDYTPERIERELPAEQRRWARDHLDWSPVNLRVLDGVDIAALGITRVEGSARSGPPKPGGYVDP